MRRWVALGAAVPLIGAVGVSTLLLGAVGTASSSSSSATPCPPAPVSVTPTSTSSLSADQLANAGIIVATGRSLGAGPAGEVVALTAAITESGLVNNPGGTSDSVGLFQERPSQGWGTAAQILDPVYAATQFYNRLLALPGWQAMAPGDAAQAIERSAWPDRYAGNVALATALVGGGAVLDNCAPTGSVAIPPNQLPPAVLAGIAARPTQVQAAIAFGLQQVGKPYIWGGTGPPSSPGFDCSGLTMAAYAAAGVSIPRTSFGQATVGTSVAEADLLPGDLVFPSGDLGHVQIALGGGLVLEAQKTGVPVLIDHLWGFVMARRVVLIG